MSSPIVSTETAEHYVWGRTEGRGADGWYLVKAAELHVIEERVPPGVSETRHSHVHARQFFYVLEGELTVEVEGGEYRLGPGEGIEVAPGQKHQVANRSERSVRILVTSQPPSQGDRVEA